MANNVILGGNGFVGQAVARHLFSRSDKDGRIRIVDVSEPKKAFPDNGLNNIEFFKADLTKSSDMKAALEGMENVIHLANTTVPETSMQDVPYDLISNVSITINLIENLKNSEVKKIVFSSSGGTVYGIPEIIPIPEDHPLRPVCAYGISKMTSEHYLRMLTPIRKPECHVVILRIANIYGEGQYSNRSQGVIPVFLERMLENKPLEIWGSGFQERDFIHITDVVDAICRSLAYNKKKYSVFNIGSGSSISILDLIEQMEELVGHKLEYTYDPKGGGHRVPVNRLRTDRAKRDLSWTPTLSLSEGLRRTWEWMRTLKKNSS